MNTEWIYLALFGLMMVFCCYPMMRMMMNGSDEPKETSKAPSNAETTDAQEALKS